MKILRTKPADFWVEIRTDFFGQHRVPMSSIRPLKFVVAAIIVLTFGMPCFAADDAVKLCAVKAAEDVSKIPGRQVKKSSTRPVPADQLATWKGQSKPIMVDIDYVSPDEAGTYSYICATGPSGQAFVRRVATP
jgi:hypothetical protein